MAGDPFRTMEEIMREGRRAQEERDAPVSRTLRIQLILPFARRSPAARTKQMGASRFWRLSEAV